MYSLRPRINKFYHNDMVSAKPSTFTKRRRRNVIDNNYGIKIAYPHDKSPNRLGNNHDIMNRSSGLIAVAAVVMLLITATGMAQGVFAHSHHHNHHHSHHHHGHGHGSSNNSQSLAQANSCGNGSGASHVNCQNLGSQIQGSGNAVNVIGSQS